MYAIFADEELLWSPNLSEEYPLISPKCKVKLNKAGSMEFTLPPGNPMYAKLKKLKTNITLQQDDETIWKGRVIHDEKDFFNRKKVYCEGQLSCLLDSIMRPYEYTGTVRGLMNKYISNHNEQVGEDKQFVLGSVTVMDTNDYIVRSNKEYTRTMDEMMGKLPNSVLGGYITTKFLSNGKTSINYLEEPGGLSSQVILFGENLLDITEYIDAENVFTVLIPLGKKAESEGDKEGSRLTIESVNGGKDYIENTTAINLFGRITKTATWEDVTVASNLLTKGREYLENGIKMAVTLKIKAVDLHLIDVDTEKIALGNYVRVVSDPHELDSYFLCSEINIDLVNPDKTDYILGTGFQAMTDRQVASMKMANTAYNTAESASETANNANNTVGDIVSGDYIKRGEFVAYKEAADKKFAVFPSVTATDNGKVMKVVGGKWSKGEDEKGEGGGGVELPPVTETDNGKVLKVSGGAWTVGDDEKGTEITDAQLETMISGKVTEYMEGNVIPKLPPSVTETDNGKVMKVAGGKWSVGEDDTGNDFTEEQIKEFVSELLNEYMKENVEARLAPAATTEDDGKVMKVSGGVWGKGIDEVGEPLTDEQLRTVVENAVSTYVTDTFAGRILPDVTAEDEGKIMKVTGGTWTLVEDTI